MSHLVSSSADLRVPSTITTTSLRRVRAGDQSPPPIYYLGRPAAVWMAAINRQPPLAPAGDQSHQPAGGGGLGEALGIPHGESDYSRPHPVDSSSPS